MSSISSSLRHAFMFGALLAAFVLPAAARADTVTATIEPPVYSLGSIDGVAGWSSFGAAGLGCAIYDHRVSSLSAVGLNMNSTYAKTFGSRALRISNAITSGCFSDQTYSPSVPNEAGEASADSFGFSGGERQPWFESAFTIASTNPILPQLGLTMTVSPDRGDGARMSYLRFEDQPAGIAVYFDDFDADVAGFRDVRIATLDRSAPHRVKFRIDFEDGPGNDRVQITIDGVDVSPPNATTWEDYSRLLGDEPSTVDSLLFRTDGTASLLALGGGFLIDNVATTTPAVGSTDPPGNPGTIGVPGPAGPSGTDSTGAGGGILADEPLTAKASTRLAPKKLRRRGSRVRVPLLCVTADDSHCIGTVEIRNRARRVVSSRGFSLKAGRRTLSLRTIKKLRKNSRVRVTIRTYQPNGETWRTTKYRRVR
ncbi:MAG: hypothetical protein ACPGWS_04720 [Solirubrobacterales bacterium]